MQSILKKREEYKLYKNKLFIIGVVIVLIAIMFYAVNNIEWFQRILGEM